MKITFVLSDSEPLDDLRRFDPDREWQHFITGERAWILQTYLRLHASGVSVELADRLPAEGIAVFSAKQRRLIRARSCAPVTALLIGVREDVGEALIADFEVVQNRHQANERTRFFVPLWPQPGLEPRDVRRGTTLKNIAFKGYMGNLHADFRSSDWNRFVTAQGLSWQMDAIQYDRRNGTAAGLGWNDFRNVDLLLAVRPPDTRLYPRKPATKLYNAWFAGVPALLGPELAYREQRRSALDYIEVDGSQAAQAAILSLIAAPARYQAMVDSGLQRSAEFGVPRILGLWQQLLLETVPALERSPRVRRWQGKPLWLKEGWRRIQRAAGLGG